MSVKALVWLGDSLERVRSFAAAPRRDIGFGLWEVQQGRSPSDWKPMTPVGPGVQEFRVNSGGTFRVIYIAKLDEAVYVLHAFEKRSRKTSKPDMELARIRFKALIQEATRQ